MFSAEADDGLCHLPHFFFFLPSEDSVFQGAHFQSTQDSKIVPALVVRWLSVFFRRKSGE